MTFLVFLLAQGLGTILLFGFGMLVFGAAATLSLNDRQLLRPYGFGNVEFGILILGALLTISAYVFNYGCTLQQESDETL